MQRSKGTAQESLAWSQMNPVLKFSAISAMKKRSIKRSVAKVQSTCSRTNIVSSNRSPVAHPAQSCVPDLLAAACRQDFVQTWSVLPEPYRQLMENVVSSIQSMVVIPGKGAAHR